MTDAAPAQFLGLASPDAWSELQSLMAEMTTAAPYWRTSSTGGVIDPPDEGWYADWDHQFRLVAYKHIEWCELYPRPEERCLTMTDIQQACEAIGFEVELAADRVRILGYRRLC